MECKNKGIIITGGNNGIGLHLCKEFLKLDYNVYMIDKDESIKNCLNNKKMHFFSGDLSIKEDLINFYEFVKNDTNDIHALINNACVSKGGILSECSYEDLDYVLGVGLKAPYMLSLLFKKDLVNNKGSIINVASSRAFQSQEDTEAYSCAKGGIVALTHALSISLKGNVRVNAIAPGWIDVCEDGIQTTEDKLAIPVERVGSAQDIFNLVTFLLDNKSGFINGETITIDGGMSKQMIYHNDHGWKYQTDNKK